MKFPSLSQLKDDGLQSAKRFPLTLLFGVLGTGLACWLLEYKDYNLWQLNLLLTFALGIPLFFCIDIVAEKRQFTPIQRMLAWGVGLLVLGLIYLSFPSESTVHSTRAPYIRYIIYNLAIHLMVAYLPYFDSVHQEAFWNYNKNLFLRLVLGIYYSSVITIGLCLALMAIDALFDVKIQYQIYPQILAVAFGIFNTWFFISGIPNSFDRILSEQDYPKGLKVFTQFILLPLLLIYLCILYVYAAKILISGNWPKGIVSYMIIAISILGIFANLLLYPYSKWKESGWIKKFNKAYYIFLIPLIILLFYAIGIRIQDYSLTVNRYIITLMGVWLTFICIYYSLGNNNIKTIPVSLSIFMILSSFGPWGMFSLSERMQRKRLAEILTENNILVNDKVQHEIRWSVNEKRNLEPLGELRTKSIPSQELYEVNSILDYLTDYHGIGNIYPWFEQDLKSLIEDSKDTVSYSSTPPTKLIVESMGLAYVPYYERLNESTRLKEMTLASPMDFEIEISEYDYLRHININTYNLQEEPSTDLKYNLGIDKENQRKLVLKWSDEEMEFDLTANLDDLFRSYGGGYHIVSAEELNISRKEDDLEIKLHINLLHITNLEGELTIQSVEGLLLIKEIKQE